MVVSGGRDLEILEDYSGEVAEQETTDFDADIVFSDGVFIMYPLFSD